METLLKLVTAVVANRLQKKMAFCKEQAGFRRNEECSGHIASLLEICQRRMTEGKKTVLTFLDLQKAFDTVPHAALLYKCERIGIRGRALRFIRAISAAPTCSVSVGGVMGP